MDLTENAVALRQNGDTVNLTRFRFQRVVGVATFIFTYRNQVTLTKKVKNKEKSRSIFKQALFYFVWVNFNENRFMASKVEVAFTLIVFVFQVILRGTVLHRAQLCSC